MFPGSRPGTMLGNKVMTQALRYDLDGDGSTVGDERLNLPRLAPLTFGAGGQCRRQLGSSDS